MRHALVPLIFLIFVLASVHADAATAYKCTGADGSVSFQDQPCRASAKQQRLSLPDDTHASAPIDDTAATDAPPSSSRAMPQAMPGPRTPAPSFFLCTRYDGSRYVSNDGIGGSSAVPYGMLDGANQSLAGAYGGRNGIGVSAPGMRTIPTIPAAQAPFAGAYVQVDDECHHAAPNEACAYLRSELDNIEDKLKRAFSDTEAQLRQEQNQLQNRLRGC